MSGDRKFRIWLTKASTVVNGGLARTESEIKADYDGGGSSTFREVFTTKKVGSKWFIVGDKTYDDQQEMVRPFSIAAAKMAGARPAVTRRMEALWTTACLSNIRQLATGALMAEQDSDGGFPFGTEDVRRSLYPYVKSADQWFCNSTVKPIGSRMPRPEVSGKSKDMVGDQFRAVASEFDEREQGSYSFNTKLKGVRASAVKDPSKTILMYEGAKGVLDFRHSGKAGIATVDGRVYHVSQSELKRFKWTP